MSDIITRLLLKTNDFDANLEKSKKSVTTFQSGIASMANTAGASVMKFAGGLGLAIGAGEGLMKTINSSQTTGDAYVKMMDQARASVDSFFSSIALGNFDGFLSNLQNVIDKAGDLSTALDNLGTKTLFNKAEVDDLNTKYQLELNKAKARNISDEERNKHLAKAKEYLIQMATLQQSLATANTDTSYTALQAEIAKMGFNKNVSREMWDYLIKDSKRSDIEKTSSAHKDKLFEYNRRIESSKVRDPYTEQVIDSDETKKIRAELKRYKESRFGLYGELNRLFIEAADDEKSAIAQALKMRATANSLKVAVSNKELEVANTDAKINGSYNKRNGGGSGSDTKIKPEKDSIAWYDTEIAKLNKKLIATTDVQAKSTIKATINELEAKKIKLQIETSGNSIEAINIQLSALNKNLITETDMQARATIQATINELEQKKINLKFVVDQEAFKIAHGEMKDGALSTPGTTTASNKPDYALLKQYDDAIEDMKAALSEDVGERTKDSIQAKIDKLEKAAKRLANIENGEKGSVYSTFRNNSSKDKKGNETDFRKQIKGMKLQKFNSPIDKKDIKLNKQYAESLGYIGDAFGSMGQMAAQFGSDGAAFALNSIGSIAQMIVQLQGLATANGVASAMSLPFPANLAAIATVVGTVASIFASMPKFATGGIVPGASFTGDKVPALLNSGEMILNGSQQSNLFQMLNSRLYGSLAEKVNPIYGVNGVKLPNSIRLDERDSKVEVSGNIKIRGCDLHLALENYDKRMRKIR